MRNVFSACRNKDCTSTEDLQNINSFLYVRRFSSALILVLYHVFSVALDSKGDRPAALGHTHTHTRGLPV